MEFTHSNNIIKILLKNILLNSYILHWKSDWLLGAKMAVNLKANLIPNCLLLNLVLITSYGLLNLCFVILYLMYNN